MPSESPEQWLAREVGDLLDAGSVPLHELVWLLNGSDFTLNDADKKAIAFTVASNIVESGRARIHELAWPSGELLGGPVDLSARTMNADAWPSEASERYLALVP